MRQLGIVENPRKSWLWDFDFMKLNQWCLDISVDEVLTDAAYLSCLWGGIRARNCGCGRTGFSQARSARRRHGGCSVLQPPRAKLVSMEDESRRMGYARTSRKGISSRFIWQMAVPSAANKPRGCSFQLRAPRSPTLQSLVGDNRSWWITRHPTQSQSSRWSQLGYSWCCVHPKVKGTFHRWRSML